MVAQLNRASEAMGSTQVAAVLSTLILRVGAVVQGLERDINKRNGVEEQVAGVSVTAD